MGAHELGRSESHRVRVPDDGVHYSALESLYALGRVVDVLLLVFQPDKSDPEASGRISGDPLWRGAIPASSAWPEFCAALGAAPVAESSFHPFFHEIVSVEQSDDADEPPTIIGCLHYNDDADPSAQSNDDLDDGDRLDLLRYRCSIRTDLGPDQWPFENTFVERAP